MVSARMRIGHMCVAAHRSRYFKLGVDLRLWVVPHMLRCSFGVGVRSFVCQLFAGQPRRCGLFALAC